MTFLKYKQIKVVDESILLFGTNEKNIKNIWFFIQAGFLKSIQRDFQTFHCHIIDFDSLEDNKFVVDKIVEEITRIDPYMETAY